MMGTVVTTQEEADALLTVETAEEEFKRAVLEVNAEFAEGYIELYEEEGYESVVGVGPNPEAAFNPESVEPQIGADTEVDEFARIVGDVSLGANSEVNSRAAIRDDEGASIVIGSNANIEERVTFHALEETTIEVGDRLTTGDDVVVFRVIAGDDVTVGEDAVIQGLASEEDPNELTLEILDGAVIPDGVVVTDEATLRDALSGAPQSMPETGGPTQDDAHDDHDH